MGSPFEVGMLMCWGVCWPFSILKLYLTKRSEGKSMIFLLLALTGYVFGVFHKLFFSLDFVLLLYLFNTALVGTDLYLTNLYRRQQKIQDGKQGSVIDV